MEKQIAIKRLSIKTGRKTFSFVQKIRFNLLNTGNEILATIRYTYLKLEMFNYSQGCFIHDFRSNLYINSGLKAFLEFAQIEADLLVGKSLVCQIYEYI